MPDDIVRHDKFGEGIVLKSEMVNSTEFLDVQFTGQHGKKRLSMDFAKLEKLYGASNKLVEEVRQEEPLLTLQLRETIPPYVSGLHSTNPSIFLNSFSQALEYQDVQNVELHTHIQHFVATCDDTVILLSSRGQREYGWKDIRELMLADKLEFEFPQYVQRNPPLSGARANLQDRGNFYVLGMVDNKGFVLPIPHYVTAVFVFKCVTCGSESTWAWKSVYICG